MSKTAVKVKKPGALTIVALERWLKKQNPETEYTYNDPRDCLMARFAKAQGYGDVRASIDSAWSVDSTTKLGTFSTDLDLISCYGYEAPRTYGGALKALQEFKKSKAKKET